MLEHQLRVTRTARYYTLGPMSGARREIWIVCHGYGQLASRFLSNFAALDDGTRTIVAPEALSRFYLDAMGTRHGPEARVGATWMTREDREREIADYVAYLDALAVELLAGEERESVRLVVLGFSQGVSTVVRWAALGSTRVDRLILWAGGLPEDLVLAEYRERFGSEPVAYLVGDEDQFLDARAVERQRHRLRDAGVEVAFHEFHGAHIVDQGSLKVVAGL